MQVSSGVQVCCRDDSSPSPTVSPAGAESRSSSEKVPSDLSTTNPLAEADHWPHGAPESAAAAETPEQEPPDIDWQSFPQSYVHPSHCRLDITMVVLPHQHRHNYTLNSSGATREWRDEGNSVSNLFERPNLIKEVCDGLALYDSEPGLHGDIARPADDDGVRDHVDVWSLQY